MNLTFLWPTLALLLVQATWQTVYNLRHLAREHETRPKRRVIEVAFGCLVQWTVIIATIAMGYKTAGVLGVIGVIVALLVLPMGATFIIAAATGRIRRK